MKIRPATLAVIRNYIGRSNWQVIATTASPVLQLLYLDLMKSVFFHYTCTCTVELVQSDTWVFRHPVTFDKHLWSQSISVNKNKNWVPYLGLYNAQDFAQILYLVGGVCIINRNNVFHSFPDWEITCLPCFFVYYCQVKYFLNCLDTIPQNN